MDFVRLGHFIPPNGPLNGHPPSIILQVVISIRYIKVSVPRSEYDLCCIWLHAYMSTSNYLSFIFVLDHYNYCTILYDIASLFVLLHCLHPHINPCWHGSLLVFETNHNYELGCGVGYGVGFYICNNNYALGL